MAFPGRIIGSIVCIAVTACTHSAGGTSPIPNPAAVSRAVTPTWGTGFTEYAHVMAGSSNSATQAGHGTTFGKKTARYSSHKRVSDAGSAASWSTKLLSVIGGAQIDNAVTITNDKKKSLFPLASNQSNAVSQDKIALVSGTLPSGSTVKYVETISIDPKTVSIPCSPANENQTSVYASSGLSGADPVSVSGKCVGKKFTWVNNANKAARKSSLTVVGSVGVALPVEMTVVVTTKQTTNGRNGLTTYRIKLDSCVTFAIKTKGVQLKADSGHDYSKCPFT